MNKMNVLLAALVTVFSVNTACAAESMYGEVGYLGLKFKDSDGDSVTPKNVRAVVGKELNDNLSVEILGSVNVKKSDGYSANTFGAYLKPKVKVIQDLELFARAGVARTTLNYPDDYTGRTTKFSYGAGVQYQITKAVYGQVDFMHYGKDNGVTARGYNISVGTRF
jgi:hypothetical protein